MTVADAIAVFLADKEITHVFGIIGAGNAALFDAITRLAKTQIVCCHHESSAVMAATYFGRTLGICGVAIVTTGAGSSNAITGAIAANMDSVPVLIISGNEPSRYVDSTNRVVGVQGFRIARVVERVVKESWHAYWPDAQGMQLAYEAATGGRPGPVWIDVPRDFFNAVV